MIHRRPSRLALLTLLLSAVLVTPDLGARPGGGQSFSPSRSSSPSTPSRSYSPSTPSRPSSPSTPSRPSSPSTPSRSSPSYPSTPSSPSRSWNPSSPSGPYVPSPSSPSEASSGDSSMTGAFLVFLLIGAGFILVVVLLHKRYTGLHGPEWETAPSDDPLRRPLQTYPSLIAALESIRQDDPEFSFVLFEDFLYALYTEAHTARGAGRLAGLSPYLSPSARETLTGLGQRPVQTVIVGGIRVEWITPGGLTAPTKVAVVFDTNYAEVDEQGAEHAFYASERWMLARPAGKKSRPPERARVLDCPSCGAPLDKLLGGTCGYCNQNVDAGDQDWNVQSIQVLAREERPPILTGTTEEAGTSDPTIVAPDAGARWKGLTAKDPALDWAGLGGRLNLIFHSFHQAWTSREPLLVRPYLSDNLFQSQLYWIDAYKRQHLVNRTDGAHVVSAHLARVVSDAHYDAVTVRVFATGRDYTVDEAGEVVAGDKDRERPYSEYWTLIRGVGHAGAPRSKPECPSCGAEADVNMAGHCKFCNAKVTAGEFDWVLSRIEQDEAYTG